MLKIQFQNGRTVSCDLSAPAELSALLSSTTVTAVSIVQNGVLYAIPASPLIERFTAMESRAPNGHKTQTITAHTAQCTVRLVVHCGDHRAAKLLVGPPDHG